MKKDPEKRAEQQQRIASRNAGPGRPPGARDKRPRAKPAPRLGGHAARIPAAVAGGACPSCSAPTVDGQNNCTGCGARLRVDECEKCHATLTKEAKFCGSCGKPRAPEASSPGGSDGKPPPSMSDLAGKPSAIPAATTQTSSATPAATAPPQQSTIGPLVVTPQGVQLPVFSVEVLFDQVDQLLRDYYKTLPLDDKEKRQLAEVWCQVINNRVRLNGPNADVWAAGIVTIMVFGPRTFAGIMWSRRERKKLEAKEAGKPEVVQAVVVEAKPDGG